MRGRFASLLIMLLVGSTSVAAEPLVLITEQEARLPLPTEGDLIGRAGITRGPKVMLVSPKSDAPVRPPVHLQLKFESFGGAKIDLSSVKVTYLRNPNVDLTERLKSAMRSDGIDVAAAQVPAGNHDIRVDVRDSGGRAGSAKFTLKISQ